MHQELQDSVWWMGMRDQCLAYECAVCDRQKKSHQRPSGLLHTTVAERPGEVLSMDLVKLPESEGFIGCAVIVDKFSGFVAMVPLRDMDSTNAIMAYDNSLGAMFVDVRVLRVDRDPVLTSNQFMKAMQARGVEVEAAFTDHQQANFVERTIQHVKQVLRTTLDSVATTLWLPVIRDVARYLNCLQLSAKGASPVEICTGWQPPRYLPFSELEGRKLLGSVFNERLAIWTMVKSAMEEAERKSREGYAKSHEDRRFVVGDVVQWALPREEKADAVRVGGTRKVKSFNLSSPWDPNPWIIDAQLSEVSYRIRSFEKEVKAQEVHVDQLKRAVIEQGDGPREQGHYVVQKIHSHQLVAPGDYDYLIEWGGWRNSDAFTWMSERELQEKAPEVLHKYKTLAVWSQPAEKKLAKWLR